MIVYHAKWEYGSRLEDLGLFATLAGGRAAVLREIQENDWEQPAPFPNTIEDVQPWFEDGASEDSPTYACEYPVNGGVYVVCAREVNP